MTKDRSYNKGLRYFGAGALVFALVLIVVRHPQALGSFFRNTFFAAQGYFFNLTKSDPSQKQTLEMLTEENNVLKTDLAAAAVELATLKDLKSENEELRELLNFLDKKQTGYIGADIIGRDPLLPNSLILNRGSADGIKPGMAVTARGNHLIGKVITAKLLTSTVLLLTDSQLAISSTLIGQKKPLGVTEGEFGLGIVVKFIPQSQPVVVGDIFVTSGDDSDIASNLLIGKVNRITSHDNDLFKEVALVPFVDIATLRTVEVVVKPIYE